MSFVVFHGDVILIYAMLHCLRPLRAQQIHLSCLGTSTRWHMTETPAINSGTLRCHHVNVWRHGHGSDREATWATCIGQWVPSVQSSKSHYSYLLIISFFLSYVLTSLLYWLRALSLFCSWKLKCLWAFKCRLYPLRTHLWLLASGLWKQNPSMVPLPLGVSECTLLVTPGSWVNFLSWSRWFNLSGLQLTFFLFVLFDIFALEYTSCFRDCWSESWFL